MHRVKPPEKASPLARRVFENIQTWLGPSETEHLLVAVSGGLDSMVLLHLLRECPWRIAVIHVDHHTRDGESAKDAAFVAARAKALGIPCHLTDWMDEAHGDAGSSFEMRARAGRYGLFEAIAEKQRYTVVLTAHHADDQAETVLMRLLKGAGPEGLAGIPNVRPLGKKTVLRPLLDTTRAELRAYAMEHEVAWREDASNEDNSFLRNRIRNELLPQLRSEYNPNLDQALCRLASLLHGENGVVHSYWEQWHHKSFDQRRGIMRYPFSAECVAYQRRSVQALLQDLKVPVSFEQVEAVRHFISFGDAGARKSLNEVWTLELSHDQVHTVENEELAASFDAREVELPLPGIVEFLGRRFVTRVIPSMSPEDAKDYCTPARQVFEAPAASTLLLRTRRDGDVFRPLGMTGSLKLKKYLSEADVPRHTRDTQPLVIINGTIAWITGHAASADFAVTSAKHPHFEIEVIDAAI
ncbi:MAG: tRNA lysidine(34) synthetase TilS [Candidatus Hydrogenedentes bacterium]|nr:tRNA lysidine(34) synthetase TilS [Candidatus Hydrogenedentota bacterium]